MRILHKIERVYMDGALYDRYEDNESTHIQWTQIVKPGVTRKIDYPEVVHIEDQFQRSKKDSK